MGKQMQYNAYLIDPVKRQVTEVVVRGDFKVLYQLLHCDIFTAVEINEYRDTIYIDDEGLYVANQVFFFHEDYPSQPLAGYGLVVGTDDEGYSIDPTVSLNETIRKVRFMSRSDVMEWLRLNPDA